MKSKFYLRKIIAAISIAICSGNYVSLANPIHYSSKIDCLTNSNLVVPNPISILTREEAMQIAKELGNGKDLGTWRTMTGEEFMRWWKACNENKTEISFNNTDSSNLVDVNGLSYFIDDDNSCAKLIGFSKDFDQNFIGKPVRIESSVSFEGKNYCVTSIDDSCFESCSDFTSIIIPNSIEKIGTKAFASSSVKYVVFERGSKINSIGESAFENSSIEFISLPKSLAFIDRSAFANCENLSILIIKNPELNFSADNFNNCVNLSHIFVPCNLKNKDIGYSGLKIEDSNFDVMKCSYSKFGLSNQEKVSSGIIHWDHEFSDWTKVENEDSKQRTCALCNLEEISVDNSEKDTTSL